MSELQVVIPYQQLVNLLEAADRCAEYQKVLDHQQAQIDALRGMFSELGAVLSDLRRDLKNGRI